MSELERILKLASHGTADAHSQAPAERELKDVPVVAEDDSQDRQLEAWCKKWSKYKGMNGDPLPMGWVLSKVDSGVTTDGIEAGEADKAMEIIYPGKGAEMKSDMSKGDAHAYDVDWGDFEIQKHLPITNAMQDEFIAIMGNDDEETMHEVYDVVKSACMESTNEAVGEFAEPIYDLIDMHFEGDCQPVFDDLVRYLSGDQIEDFVADFRRNHDLPMGDDMDEAQQLNASDYSCEDCGDTMHQPTTDCSHDCDDETGSWWKDKDGNGVPDSLEEAPNEGNEFSGELAKAKAAGKKEFEVDGKKYKVEEQEINELNVPNDKEKVKARIAKLMKMAKDAKDAGDSNKAYSIERSSEMSALHKKLSKLGESEEDTVEEISEAPTMDTTQLVTMMKNAGLSEEAISEKLNEWANTPEGAAEEESTVYAEPYELAQSVNLSLKRYLDAESMKVGIKEHTVEELKEAYKKSKGE